ncbi:MAG: glutamate synthase [Thermodesulfobacteriota bacterium]
MCRLFALTCDDPVPPMQGILALDAMREGHDGSGVGLFLTDLDGPWKKHKKLPILSGIFTDAGVERLDAYMDAAGFTLRHAMDIAPEGKAPRGVPKRDRYVLRAYEPPQAWNALSELERGLGYVRVRLDLRRLGEADESATVFSFWPDAIMIKEIGDPLHVGMYLGLDRQDLAARVMLAQGRQNTNYAINLYACHPFFIQGVASMTNGENTAFVPIREYLQGLGVTGYEGYNSDSEVFTHILHYTLYHLQLSVEHYKHVITPLKAEEMDAHPDSAFLRNLSRVCRKFIIDGPNCVIGCLPDKTLFMVQDRKKLRPGVVGGRPGFYAFSSEVCGIDAAIPDRDPALDFQPMYQDTAIVTPKRTEIRICRQTHPLALQH